MKIRIFGKYTLSTKTSIADVVYVYYSLLAYIIKLSRHEHVWVFCCCCCCCCWRCMLKRRNAGGWDSINKFNSTTHLSAQSHELYVCVVAVLGFTLHYRHMNCFGFSLFTIQVTFCFIYCRVILDCASI